MEQPKEKSRMPLRPIMPEPTDFCENKLIGAETLHVVLKGPSGLDFITTTDNQPRFLFGPTWSVVAVVNTFNITPVTGSFHKRLELFKQKQKDEPLTGHISSFVTEGDFPLEEREDLPYQVHLVKFTRRATSDEAISLLSGDKMWMRPGTFEELVDFGLNYPKVQEYHRVVALGSTAKILQEVGEDQVIVEFVPALSAGKFKTLRRMLIVLPYNTKHLMGQMFLAVSKSPRKNRIA